MSESVSESLVVMPVERKDGTYALRICCSQGLLTVGMMKRVLDVMEKFGLPSFRATTGQRFNIEGVASEQLDDVVSALGKSVEKCPPGASVCPGGGVCRYGVLPTRELGEKLVEVVKANGPYPYKVKSGVSGCKMVCGMSYVRDVGLVATSKGWSVYFAGSARRDARVGVLLGSGLSESEALALVEKALVFYKENGRKRERTSHTISSVGEEALLEALR